MKELEEKEKYREARCVLTRADSHVLRSYPLAIRMFLFSCFSSDARVLSLHHRHGRRNRYTKQVCLLLFATHGRLLVVRQSTETMEAASPS